MEENIGIDLLQRYWHPAQRYGGFLYYPLRVHTCSFLCLRITLFCGVMWTDKKILEPKFIPSWENQKPFSDGGVLKLSSPRNWTHFVCHLHLRTLYGNQWFSPELTSPLAFPLYLPCFSHAVRTFFRDFFFHKSHALETPSQNLLLILREHL